MLIIFHGRTTTVNSSAPSLSTRRIPGDLPPLRGPEDAVHLLDALHQLLGMAQVHLDLAGGAELRRPPEQVVQLGELFQVRRLEVVRPEDEQLGLGNPGLLWRRFHFGAGNGPSDVA